MKESDNTALVEELQADFKRRQEERRTIERGWQLNLNFLSGNQYCDVNALGELEYASGGYYRSEERRVGKECACQGRARGSAGA